MMDNNEQHKHSLRNPTPNFITAPRLKPYGEGSALILGSFAFLASSSALVGFLAHTRFLTKTLAQPTTHPL